MESMHAGPGIKREKRVRIPVKDKCFQKYDLNAYSINAGLNLAMISMPAILKQTNGIEARN